MTGAVIMFGLKSIVALLMGQLILLSIKTVIPVMVTLAMISFIMMDVVIMFG